jgi:cell division protein FtsZ
MRLEIVEEAGRFGRSNANPTVIKVIGVGGGGSNAVNRMIDSSLRDVHFVAMNTDLQALDASRAPVRIPLGTQTTGGLGAGGDPGVGEKAALEDKDTIKKLLEGADMVFITAGMGGGTGTGAAPVIASVARDMGILCVAVVTRPFALEGKRKSELADEGIRKLREHVDTLITIPNQNLLRIVQKNTPMKQALLYADDVLRQGVQGISDLITKHGEINIDFADVRTIMKGRGDALMGVGIGTGDNRAVDAATHAIHNPLLEDTNIEGAQGILVNVTGGPDLSLSEYEEILNIVNSSADPNVLIIAGMAIDEALGDAVQVTMIATGFKNHAPAQPAPTFGSGAHAGASYGSPAAQAAANPARRQTDTLSLDEWNSVFRPNQPPAQTEHKDFSHLFGDSNLDVPAFLRQGQKNPPKA